MIFLQLTNIGTDLRVFVGPVIMMAVFQKIDYLHQIVPRIGMLCLRAQAVI
ncbi:hypothetical protein SDC9_151702 [bioreactor metagenome]|uniref:Uncharacterized protein n=1 Tax=bioreactor metagenome TaxID=1076179 RepID=A0A645EVF4_9ZZZZ